MGNKTKFKKLRSILLTPLAIGLRITSRIRLVRQFWERLYRFGLGCTLDRLSKLNEIISIYSKTDFSQDFIAGVSDIDLAIITKNLTIEDEIHFLKKIYNLWIISNILFPFIAPFQIYGLKDFDKYQKANKISRKNKHFSDWSLIFGKESRQFLKEKPTEISRFEVRREFEDLLLNIYESHILKEEYLRRFYRSAYNIFRTDCLNRRLGEDNDKDLKKYLICQTNDQRFVEEFFNLPKKNYWASKEMQIRTLFYTIRILENIFARVRNIKFKKQIICNIPINNKLSYNYFLAESKEYIKFKEEINQIIESIKKIKDFIEVLKYNPKSRFGIEFKIFPLIITNKLMNSLFIDSIYPFESISLEKIQKKKFHTNIQQLKESFDEFNNKYILPQVNTIFHRAWFEIRPKRDELIEYAMAYRLLNEKNKVCIISLGEEYRKNFKNIYLKSNNPKDKYIFIRSIIKK